MSPSPYLKTRKGIQKHQRQQRQRTDTESNLFGGFLFSQNQTAKASTEKNKTPRKQTQKATITKRRRKRKEEEAKPAERSEDMSADRQHQKKHVP